MTARTGATKRYSIAEARNQLARIVHRAERGERIELTRRGKAVAILVSAGEYQQLSRRRPDFWGAWLRFREQYGDDLGIDADAFEGLRDPSPGRDVDL